MKQVTQKQVAERAGVCRATVSYVLNGKSSEGVPISEETRKRVLDAIQALEYRPNLQARSLRSGRAMTIGVLILDVHNPHFWQFLSGVEAEAHRHGYTIMVFHTALKKSEEDVALRELTQKRIDGAIINTSYARSMNDRDREFASGGMPIVDLSDRDSPFDRMVCDYRPQTAELLSHLYGLGHRRYGLVYGVANVENGLDRLEPFNEFVAQNGISPEHARVIPCEPTQQAGYEAAAQLLRQPGRPTAIMAINDHLAMGVLRAAADLGVAVPGELSVCGFDDIPFSQFTVPRLTTVRRETEQGGARAFQLLLDRMNGMTGSGRVEHVGASLQIRESTGPAPAGQGSSSGGDDMT